MCGERVTAFLWVMILFSAPAVVRAEMVHHWQFEGNSNDSVGGWNGTGGIGFVPGKMGQAANFGGTAASDITFTFNTAGLKNITVAFWMKLDTAWTPGKAGIGRVMGSADNFECVLGPSSGGTGQVANNFFISGGTYPLSTTIPTPGTWYHVALTSSLSTAGGTGRAEVWIETNGLRTSVAILEEDACIGENSVLTGEARSATILALEDCLAVEVQKSTLAPIIGASPELLESLSDLLAQRRMKNEGLVAEAAGSGNQSTKSSYKAGFLGKLRTFFEV